jgi:phytanoyl-CoA hydroxylase
MSDIRTRFDHDGFVVVPQVVDHDSVAAWCAHLARFVFPPNGVIPLQLDTDPVARDIAGHTGLLEVATLLLAESVELFGATYVVKLPQSPWHVSWHQDGEPWRRQWGIERAITLWVALDDAGAHNGGLRMIPGSHRQPLQALEPVEDAFDVFGYASPPAVIHEEGALTVELRAGDVSAHHPAIVHASGFNESRVLRRGLSIRFRIESRYTT